MRKKILLKLFCGKIDKFIQKAKTELGQAQHNWNLGFAEAEIGTELGNIRIDRKLQNESYSTT